MLYLTNRFVWQFIDYSALKSHSLTAFLPYSSSITLPNSRRINSSGDIEIIFIKKLMIFIYFGWFWKITWFFPENTLN
jgi:hypothetical protein